MRNDQADELIAIIDRKEGRFFVLRLYDRQELRVPIHALARTAQEGDAIHLQLRTEAQAKATKTELAQSILEEILNGE